MPTSRRSVLLGAAAAGALPLLRAAPARAARQPGQLVFGLSSYPPSFSPWVQAGTAAGTVNLLLHRGLLSFAPDGTLRGELAERWERDGDRAWVFRLRDGAAFHDGSPVTSADVQWTIEQVTAPRTAAYMRPQFEAAVERVEAPDPRSVRFVTKGPVATLPLWLAASQMPVCLKDSGGGGKVPVGCGPFTLAGQERGVSLDLAAFPRFYKPGLPKLKAIRVAVYADENARVSALQAGDVDLIEYVPWQAMGAIEADPRLRLDAVDGPFMYLTFNGREKPFDDPRVRRAVAHAIKRDEIVKSVFYGRGSALPGVPIVNDSPFHDAALADGWAYDPALSRKLLAEAGAGGGLACTLLATAQYGMHKDTAELVQQHLAAVGIQAQLSLPDWATRVALGNRGQYQVAVGGTTADNNDPDGLASVLDSSLAPAAARSVGLPLPRLHELFDAGRAEFDDEKRRAIYAAMQREAIEQVPMVSLAWRSQGYAMARNVQGFRNMPGALTFLSGTTLENTSLG